jgi:hypothetical protein
MLRDGKLGIGPQKRLIKGKIHHDLSQANLIESYHCREKGMMDPINELDSSLMIIRWISLFNEGCLPLMYRITFSLA